MQVEGKDVRAGGAIDSRADPLALCKLEIQCMERGEEGNILRVDFARKSNGCVGW